ncbi:right-handed parallel beta-helix repeat-containing protein [Candidatus Pacearchaeota archaeon]|nr:right-handed parallel beta-helix repeat-containing protein [Candidatus Pacearchaeota archaeon]
MKKKRVTCGIYLIILLFMLNVVRTIDSNSFQIENPRDLVPKVSASDINIITPINQVYNSPMSGFYPSTYGFENDTTGAAPSYWDVYGGEVQVLQNVAGHEKVLDLHQTALNYRATNQFGEKDNGTIEFYIRYVNRDYSATIRLLAVDNTPLIMFGINNNNFNYWDGSWNDLGIYVSEHKWYHMRIDFECTTNNYQNLAQWKWHIIINGFEYGDYSFASNVKPGNLEFGGWGHYSTYIDAVGYSWDPYYKVGDNIKRGLLVSFTSIANPTWTRYSLDGLPNRTIWGNITIELPSNGLHSIQVFAFNTTVYSSEIRYFTINWIFTELFPIFIDDSNLNFEWSKIASENDWCSGSGTIIDPYIIEYVWIDGSAFYLSFCITIQNSNASFIIRNSNCTNARGIRLENVTNGKIQQNNFPYTDEGVINLIDSSNNEILDNTLEGGVYLEGTCSYNKIIKNYVSNGYISIAGSPGSGYNEISENTLKNERWGIYVSGYCNNTTIRENSISNSDLGVELFYIRGIINLIDNTITNCFFGVYLNNINNSFISRNRIYNNDYGINLAYLCFNNKITQNIIKSNNMYGSFISNYTNNNGFYNNSYISNVLDTVDNGANNYWNNSIIGNYWDDYKGYDLNGDFIGDDPYDVPGTAGSIDYLPIWNWTGNDNIEPKITVNLPQPFNISGYDPPTFNISIEEYSLEEVWYTLNNSLLKIFIFDNGTVDPTYWDTIDHGLIPLTFFANDTSGNDGSMEVLIYKDILAPNITILGPHPDYWQIYRDDTYPSYLSSNPPTFQLLISEQCDRTWYTIDGGKQNFTFTGLKGTINQKAWRSMPDGEVTITFYAEDLVGHIGYAEVTINKLFDVTDYYPIIILGVVGFLSILTIFIVLFRRRRRRKRLNNL